MTMKKGSLVVIGSGIKAVGQFTLQARAHIRKADIVLYAASDPVTDIWIREQNPNSFDLYQYYADDKARIMTYVQMIERIMEEVRSGKNVCALFYGHPGVFVTPSHNAITIARQEGYDAVMLPAISAEDCLYADLGVDPSIPGLQIYEATDFLLRRRKVDTSVNLMLFQVGCVGELGFKFGGYSNNKFAVLLDYLEEIYGPDHIIVNYCQCICRRAGDRSSLRRRVSRSRYRPQSNGGLDIFYRSHESGDNRCRNEREARSHSGFHTSRTKCPDLSFCEAVADIPSI
jgi:hypothetical protein